MLFVIGLCASVFDKLLYNSCPLLLCILIANYMYIYICMHVHAIDPTSMAR